VLPNLYPSLSDRDRMKLVGEALINRANDGISHARHPLPSMQVTIAGDQPVSAKPIVVSVEILSKVTYSLADGTVRALRDFEVEDYRFIERQAAAQRASWAGLEAFMRFGRDLLQRAKVKRTGSLPVSAQQRLAQKWVELIATNGVPVEV
jgi:hypothetical protein